MYIAKKPLALAVVCIPAIYATARPLRAGVDTESELVQTREKSSSSLGISLKLRSRRITNMHNFIIKITLTNYDDEDIQIIRTPNTVLYNRKCFTEVDSDNGTLPQGLADSLEWIDLGDGKPSFRDEYDREKWDINQFVNPIRKAVKDKSTWNRRRGSVNGEDDGESEEVGSKSETEGKYDGFGFEPDAAERKKRLVTLKKKGMKLSGSSSKTFLYDVDNAYIFSSQTGEYSFQLKSQEFWYTRDGGRTTIQKNVTLEEEFKVRIALED